MNIFITGANGFIGRHLKKYLESRYSYTIYAPSSKELDLSKEAAVSDYVAAHKISAIIHLANRGGGRDTMGLTDLAEYNLRMFFAIMSQAKRVERVLHFGSGAEYSKHKPIVSASEPSYLEALPLDSYGFYKNIASRFIESTRGNVVCLRIFGCYGAGENYRYKFISNAIVKNLLHLPITIYKDCIFDYIYIDDLCAIIDHFLHASISRLDHRVYNASSGSGILLSELATLINTTSSYKSPIHFIESGLNNQYTSDNARLLQAMPALKLTPHSHAIESMREYFASNLASLDVESIKADPYLSKIGGMWAAADNNGGGGVTLRRVGFLRRDSACSDKAGSLPFACAIDAQALSPRKSLRNPAFSSTILESSFLSSLRADNGGAAIHKNKARKVDSSPKILESQSGSEKHKSTASKFKREPVFHSIFTNNAHSPSLRALAQDKARQSTHSTQVDSGNARNVETLESTFSMDSACGLESWIAARARRLHTPSMRPCTRLQNHNSSSTILESQDPLKSPTILESHSGSEKHKSTASKFKREPVFHSIFTNNAHSPSLRALAQDKARQSTQSTQVDSGNARNVETLESIFTQSFHSASTILESHSALEIQAACKNLAQLLESIFDKTQMDCHDLPSKSRNDRENAPILKQSAKDSRIFAHNAQSAFDTKAAGGRIC